MFRLYSLDSRATKRWHSLAEECQRRLNEQHIVPGDPGTILKDIQTLIEFIGPRGIVTQGRNATFPIQSLPELNARISHPITLCLKRALLQDYPNLSGLFILLRVMNLVEVNAKRLVLGPMALEFWPSLNPTEQYFALLEALLFQAQTSVLGGEQRRIEEPAITTVPIFLGQLSDRWRYFDLYDSTSKLGVHGEIPPWNLFVQQQLGLIEIRPRPHREQERRECGARGWLIGGARLTAWGTALSWALLEFVEKYDQESERTGAGESACATDDLPPEMPREDLAPALGQPEAGQGDASGVSASEAEDAEPDEPLDESESEAVPGVLRPVFQPYFPEWRTVYAQPKPAVRTGTHIFKVTVAGWRGGCGGIWRRLAVPADTSLDGLAGAILDAFAFDEDHLYDFRYRDRRGKNRVYYHPFTDQGPSTPEITVGESELGLKDEMLFTFDYGDNWEFRIRLENVDAQPSGLTDPKVIGAAGQPPPQYPPAE